MYTVATVLVTLYLFLSLSLSQTLSSYWRESLTDCLAIIISRKKKTYTPVSR